MVPIRTDKAKFWLLVATFALLTGLFAACVALRMGGAYTTDVADNVGQLVASLVAAIMCAAAAHHLGQRRTGWALMAAATVATSCGQAVYCYYVLVLRAHAPAFSVGDVFELLAVPLAAVGLLSLPGVIGTGAGRLRDLLDRP